VRELFLSLGPKIGMSYTFGMLNGIFHLCASETTIRDVHWLRERKIIVLIICLEASAMEPSAIQIFWFHY
jgi:hypothetical protein